MSDMISVCEQVRLRANFDDFKRGLSKLAQSGPLQTGPFNSKQVEVNFTHIAIHDDSAVLSLALKPIGRAGELFPPLENTEITLTREDVLTTQLSLTGSYQPPPNPLDNSPFSPFGKFVSRRFISPLAQTLIQDFIRQVGYAISPSAKETKRPLRDNLKLFNKGLVGPVGFMASICVILTFIITYVVPRL